MPSPFPGMNPYLEAVLWHDFHERFLPAAAAQLTAQVRPKYRVLIDENVYVHDLPPEERRLLGRPDLSVIRGEDARMRGAAVGVLEAPAHVLLPAQDMESLSYLKILDREGRDLVAVVELLSPTNKRAGDHRAQYLSKRSEVLQSPAHLVEIDLLRGGAPMPVDKRPACVFSVLVSRADRRPEADFWRSGSATLCRRSPSPFDSVTPTPGSTSGRSSIGSTTSRAMRTSCISTSPTRPLPLRTRGGRGHFFLLSRATERTGHERDRDVRTRQALAHLADDGVSP